MQILALDIGSSSIKSALCSPARIGLIIHTPFKTSRQDTHAEVNPNSLLQALERAIHTTLQTHPKKNPPIDALVLDVFSPGLVLAKENGQPLTPIITHQDRRSIAEAHEIEKRIGQSRHLKIAGNRPFPGGIASTTLKWLKKNQPNLFPKFGNPSQIKIAQASSLILHHLTGQWLIDPSQAAFLGLLDIRTVTPKSPGQWSEELCQAIGIKKSWLPQLAFADQPLPLLPKIAHRLHLPLNTPIIGGLVDTSAAMLATPMHPGQLVHNCGTTDVLALLTKLPTPAPDILTRPLGTGAVLPPHWLAVSTMAAGSASLDWARQTLFSELTTPQWNNLLKKILTPHPTQKNHPTTNTTPAIFIPGLAGDRTQIDQLTAQFQNLTLATTRQDMLRAIATALIAQSAQRFTRLNQIQKILPTIQTMGGAKSLSAAMHKSWPSHHHFHPLNGEAFTGLLHLAQAALKI